MLYPLIMTPYFRHGPDTPWGGDALRALGKDIPDDVTGESLEISALPGMESVISNGALAGQPLPRAIARWGTALTGTPDGTFPLMVKLLCARERLSVQVHPDDAYARSRADKLGKTEAWLILNAEPGARIVMGLKPDAPPLDALPPEAIEDALRFIPVRAGDVYHLPSGLVHALGAGIVAYELQQSSDLTYRLWDWNRRDAHGAPRTLHTQDALAVMRPALRPEKLPGATVIVEGGSRTLYIADDYFELSRLNVAGRMPLEAGRMRLLTALAPCRLHWMGDEEPLALGQSCVIPAALEGVSIGGHAPVMCARLPDKARARAELGDRAEWVAGLMD